MPRFDSTVTLGTVLILITWVGSVVALAWRARAFFDSKTAELKAEMVAMKEEVKADLAVNQERLVRLETKVDVLHAWWERQIERRAPYGSI